MKRWVILTADSKYWWKISGLQNYYLKTELISLWTMLTKLTGSLYVTNQKLMHEEYKTRKDDLQGSRFFCKMRQGWASESSKLCNGWLWLWGNDRLMTSDVACSPNCWCKKKNRSDLRNDDKKWIQEKNWWGKKKWIKSDNVSVILQRLSVLILNMKVIRQPSNCVQNVGMILILPMPRWDIFEMTYLTSYKITDIKTKQSFIVNSPIYENIDLMAIGLENNFSVEVIGNWSPVIAADRGWFLSS